MMRERMEMGQKGFLFLIFCFLLLQGNLSVKAETIYDSPYVTFSPDGRAWTTDADDQNVKWYREDGSDDVYTGIQSSLARLQEGEHYYSVWRVGRVPIACWKVSFSKVNCCHVSYPDLGENYHGIVFNRGVCLKPHFSGWGPYCADCGSSIGSTLYYMSKEAAASIRYLDVGMGLDYYYLCPFNHNLEQGITVGGHICKAVSKNRYCVEYFPNAQGEAYAGYMAPSFHFYDNAILYEGKEVTPQTHLNKNTYRRLGWRFVGWNTKPDGSGDFYADEAEIKNLTAEQYEAGRDGGKVQLYAIWKRCSGQLDLILNDCAYKGQTGVYSVIEGYGESYEADGTSLTPPVGYCVKFNTSGGKELPEMRGTQHFVEWVPVNFLEGKLEGEIYWFLVPDQNVDAICPVFERDPIILPKPTKEGQSFGGWYYDENFSEFAGTDGSEFLPERDMTLYARWVELQLQATDNYKEYSGSGAVDLSWAQPDGRDKVYQVFQSTDGKKWQLVSAAKDVGNVTGIRQTFAGDGMEHRYSVQYSGLYQITAYGAQGGNYRTYSGGKGGRVIGTFWLNGGETVLARAGAQYGDSSGGQGNLYAGGGGYSSVKTDQKGLLLLAGGGGGAGESGSGLPGGSAQSLVANGQTGESGGSGGGGGYKGGRAGELIVHHHVTGACNHIHTGNPSQYGGCYTVPVPCGMELEHEYDHSDTWYWGGYDEQYCPNCGADASKGETCTGHETDYYSHSCPIHGERDCNTHRSTPSVCTEIAYYAPGCGMTESYICGYTENQILSSKPAYGGSSYVNATAARNWSMASGMREGSGWILVESQDIGYQLGNRLWGVKATDTEKPKKIELGDVDRSVERLDVIRVSWREPEDEGTLYYHQVKSHDTATMVITGISNVTENTLISGIAGYYYCVDLSPEKKYVSRDYSFLKQRELRVTLSDKEQYLHLASVDVAGNVSDVTNIALGTRQKGPGDVRWKLHTEPLQIEEGEHVYRNPINDIYYVKCDGYTPFAIEYAAYMEGPATSRYRLTHNILESVSEGGAPARNIVSVPRRENIEESPEEIVQTKQWTAEGLSFQTQGNSLLHNGNYISLRHENYGRNAKMKQEFVLERETENKCILLIPIAGAELGERILYSDRGEDEANGLKVIGDGTAPEIYGADALETLKLIDRRDGQFFVQISAMDVLSGVREFYLEIENLDNGAKQKVDPDDHGNIHLDITEDIPIFSGDFTITITAVDNVGNENQLHYATMEFDLQTKVERILEPHEPLFQTGESGILTITTWGYAERIEVEFPEEMAELDESLNRTYVYDLKTEYRHEETIEFQVPLYVPERENYTVTVRAYKGDRMLEQHPAFAVMDVEGTVLDELRTRLR